MCTRGLAFLTVLAMAAMVLSGCQSTPAGAGSTEPVTILRQQRGSDPALKQANELLINSAAQLKALNSAELAKLNVNFDRESLIVLALGQRPTAGYWARITGVQRRDSDVYVQGVANQPAPGQAVAQVITYPYAAAVVAKVTGQLHPEIEPVTGMPETVKPVSATKPAK